MISLDSLLADPARVTALEIEQVPAVFAALAGLQTALAGRLLNNGRHEPAVSMPDKMLTVEEAAALIHESETWIKRHAKRLPFCRCISRKRLVISEAALNRWLASRKA
jgi:hypothetical protein